VGIGHAATGFLADEAAIHGNFLFTFRSEKSENHPPKFFEDP
jgi:hypothetical protein